MDALIIVMDNPIIRPQTLPTMLDRELQLLRSGHFRDFRTHHMRRHRSMDYLIFWVLGGRGWVSSEGRRVEVGPGGLITLLKGRPQEYGADPRDPWELVWVHFVGRLAPVFVKRIRSHGGMLQELGMDDELRDRWMDLVIFHAAKAPGFEVKTNTSLYALLGLIIHKLEWKSKRVASRMPFDVHGLQAYIHDHMAGRITLEEMARHAGLSVPHFCRVFRRLFLVSPLQYVLQKRVTQACSMIAESSMPLKQVGQAVGIEDPYYFSRMFRKIMGISPSAWRRNRARG